MTTSEPPIPATVPLLFNIAFINFFLFHGHTQLVIKSYQIFLRNLPHKNSFLSAPTTDHILYQIPFIVISKENDRDLPHPQPLPRMPSLHATPPSSQVPR